MKKIMILAGEASGDLHGAHLVREVLKRAPGLRFFGMGGRELKNAGVEILVDASQIAVVGAVEVISHAGAIWRAIHILTEKMAKERPDLIILIDFPDFNLHIAQKACWYAIPILYYISPQVWAWRRGRVKKIGRLARRVAVILPFEKAFYQQFGIEVEYVGHPLMDSVTVSMPAAEWRRRKGIPSTLPLIGLLPGSRRREIRAMLPTMLQAAEKISESLLCRFLLPLAPSLSEEDLAGSGILQFKGQLTIIREDRYEAMAACDAAVAASGTVTLELAILGTPMVVIYRLSPLSYFLGRLFIGVSHVCLVNLIAREPFVPELLQDKATPEKIAGQTVTLLMDRQQNSRMRRALTEVHEILGGPGASGKVAGIVLDMLQ